jgi:hypothetical protein
MDVPSGVWHEDEYKKLPAYDRELSLQPRALFMCHHNDDCLCGGWLKTHGATNLLSILLTREELDPSITDYNPDVDVFETGAAAAAHGINEIDNVGREARIKIINLMRKQALRAKEEGKK